MTMTNFTAADMPGGQKAKPVAEPETEAPVEETVKVEAEPVVVVEAAAPEAVEEQKAPEQTDTETHGVGPSTVEGGNEPTDATETKVEE